MDPAVPNISNLAWINDLPEDIKNGIIAISEQDEQNIPVLDKLYRYLNDELETKRRKTSSSEPTELKTIKMISDYSIQINRKVLPEETIFELPQISFQSPIRKKMNLVLHLIDENGANPILLIINASNSEPELSFIQLDKAIKLCVLLPILGGSTLDSKKNTGSLCFWLNEKAVADPTKNDPIICQINLDLIKKHLVKTGKIPATAESLMQDQTQRDGIKRINESIVQFLTRQFQLCGIHLINYMPSCDINRNNLKVNQDTGIVISHNANTINDMLLIEAYKGSKDGALLLFNKNEFNPAYIAFGFKKPILLFPISDVVSYSCTDITKYTFTITFDIRNETKKDNVEIIQFSMIDQKYYNVIEDFLKLQNINDNSFDDNLREKPMNANKTEGETNGDTETNINPIAIAEGEEDDSEEEDGNYQGGEEEEEDEDVAEEYDSNAEGSDEENGSGQEVGEEEEEEEEDLNETANDESQQADA